MDIAAMFLTLSPWSIVLFIVGILFFVVEMHQPGFGVWGTLGAVCLLLDIVITAKTLVQGLVLAGIILLVLLVLFLVCMRLFSKGKMPKHLVLQSSTAKQEGFSGTPDLRGLVGKTGKTVTVLRPAGCVLVDGRRFDVVSNGEFIEPDTDVVVTEVEGNRIVVKERETANLS